MARVLNGDVSPSTLGELLAASVKPTLADPADASETTEVFDTLRDAMNSLPFPPETMLDLVTRLADIPSLSEGNATVALLRIPDFPDATPSIFFLTKESGAFRLVDSMGNLTGIARECLSLLDAKRVDDARAWFTLMRSQHDRMGDFPDFSKAPVFKLLPAANASQEDLRLAAGYILSGSRSKSDALLGVDILMPRWRTETDAARKTQIEESLAEGLLTTGRMDDLLQVAGSFTKDAPDNVRALELLCLAMDKAGKTSEADALVKARSAANPKERILARLLATRLAGTAHYAEAIQILAGVLDSGEAELTDYNSLAWYSLYTGVPDPDLIAKRQIIQRLMQGSSSVLHTLACVLADSGRILEAQEVFGKYLEKRGSREPEPATWLAYGMLAQRFGLADTAVYAFQKVTLAKGYESEYPGISSWKLAQMHLKEAQAAKK